VTPLWFFVFFLYANHDMKPYIKNTDFGSIELEHERYDHDIIISLSGEVKKRKKKLSKAVYGSSHTISEDEARYVYEKGAAGIIIGSGQYGVTELSEEAAAYFKRKKCLVTLLSTPEAIKEWNKAKGKLVGLFHVTC